ncbi:hypothetical protein SNE40_001630 [Patella caerulea]|uniref:Uncharacterized protein n=1 Tax=Patella caerulea TaxID=87958 RepID=A0AAN8K7H7_PATCE
MFPSDSNSNAPEPIVIQRCDHKTGHIKSAGNILDTSFGHFRQYVADNVDCNPCTLGGKKSLHAMGMIETVTPEIANKVLIKRNPKVRRDIPTVHD